MKLIKGHFYKIVFDVKGVALTFNCEIIEDDDIFVTFIDKYGKSISYNKNTIISVEEVNQ